MLKSVMLKSVWKKNVSVKLDSLQWSVDSKFLYCINIFSSHPTSSAHNDTDSGSAFETLGCGRNAKAIFIYPADASDRSSRVACRRLPQ
jgi:hypothetical protein